MHFDKENLIDNKKDDLEDRSKNNSKRDYIIKQLFKIKELIDLYDNKNIMIL